MVASVTNPADLANLALTRMGYRLRVGSLFDGSTAAKTLLDVYAQTRDELLRDSDWDFAEGNIALTLLKSSPVGGYIPPTVWDPATNPPLPWRFEYSYPDDCIKVRSVKQTPLFVPNFDPQPTLFSLVNDKAYAPARRVIVTNVPDAICCYTRQVVDPATWDVGFVQSLAIEIGKSVGPGLVGLDSVKLALGEEAVEVPKAEAKHG